MRIFLVVFDHTLPMKKRLDEQQARQIVGSLLGQSVHVKVDCGRNKVSHYDGVVDEAHSNVFVLRLKDCLFDHLSCTYSQVVCGEIVLKPIS